MAEGWKILSSTPAFPNPARGKVAHKCCSGLSRHVLKERIMNPFSAFAVYFIIWWTSLFAVLSLGLKTQEEAGEVIPGTPASAPQGRHMWRVVLINTLIATLLFGVFYYVFAVRGWTFDDLPNFLPAK
jgi:predicted secreted protein